MLGVLYRFTPLHSVNFMPKWIEVNSEGINYFQTESNDTPIMNIPLHTIKDINPIVLLKTDDLLN